MHAQALFKVRTIIDARMDTRQPHCEIALYGGRNLSSHNRQFDSSAYVDTGNRRYSIMKGKFVTTIDIYDKAVVVKTKWGVMRANKVFFGMSLEEFTAVITPSKEAREEIADLESRLQRALARRDEADKVTRRAVIRIVNAVKGDPEEGEDSELLAAMGYLPHTARSSLIGIARRSAAKAAQKSEAPGKAGDIKT